MSVYTLSVMLAESEAVLLLRVSQKRKMTVQSYMRWLANRFLLEVVEGRKPLPAPQVGPRDWPHSGSVDQNTFSCIRAHTSTARPKRITPRTRPVDPSLPTVSELVRALLHDDARRLGVIFDKDWKWNPIHSTATGTGTASSALT